MATINFSTSDYISLELWHKRWQAISIPSSNAKPLIVSNLKNILINKVTLYKSQYLFVNIYLHAIAAESGQMWDKCNHVLINSITAHEDNPEMRKDFAALQEALWCYS